MLRLRWNLRFKGKITKLNICHHRPTSSTELRNRSVHVKEREPVRSVKKRKNVTPRFRNHFSIIQSHCASKCVPTIMEVNWDQRFKGNKTKLNICHHRPTSSTQLKNKSFHVVERTRTSAKFHKTKKCTCKACKA